MRQSANTQFEFDLGNLDLDESHTADGRVKSNIIDFFYLTQWAKYLKKVWDMYRKLLTKEIKPNYGTTD